MSKTTKTETQKKNVGYRLLAVLVLAVCVGIFFLPLSTFTSAWAVEKQTLVATMKAVFASSEKMFGVIPVLVGGNAIVPIAANVALYAFVIALACYEGYHPHIYRRCSSRGMCGKGVQLQAR